MEIILGALQCAASKRKTVSADGDPPYRRKPMVMDWNHYHKEIGARVGDLAKLSPDTVKGYQTLSAANSKTSKLGEKTRQLISLAVAVTTRCDGCIVFHTEAPSRRARLGKKSPKR